MLPIGKGLGKKPILETPFFQEKIIESENSLITGQYADRFIGKQARGIVKFFFGFRGDLIKVEGDQNLKLLKQLYPQGFSVHVNSRTLGRDFVAFFTTAP